MHTNKTSILQMTFDHICREPFYTNYTQIMRVKLKANTHVFLKIVFVQFFKFVIEEHVLYVSSSVEHLKTKRKYKLNLQK